MTDAAVPPTTPGAQPPLSAGTLLYLFGDHVVPAVGTFGMAVEMPYSGAKVSAPDLSALVFAVSFWNLRQQGALQLQPTTKKALGLVSQEHVAVAFGPNLGPRSGYEDVIMREVSQGRAFAQDVVHHWYPRDVDSPEHQAFSIARAEISQHGLGQEVDAGRGAVAGAFLGKTKLQVDPARVQGQWETFWAVHQAWLAFWQHEQPLAHALVESCRRAISGRRERDRNDF